MSRQSQAVSARLRRAALPAAAAIRMCAATLTVTATGGSGNQAVAGGTSLLAFSGEGIAASDYSFNTSSVLSLFEGPPPSVNISFSVSNDSVDEPNEALVVSLQSLPSGFWAGTTASVLIVD